jgi:hypothetical protein
MMDSSKVQEFKVQEFKKNKFVIPSKARNLSSAKVLNERPERFLVASLLGMTCL